MVVISDRYCVERSVLSGVENAILIERAKVFSRHVGLVQYVFDEHVERDQFAKQACGENSTSMRTERFYCHVSFHAMPPRSSSRTHGFFFRPFLRDIVFSGVGYFTQMKKTEGSTIVPICKFTDTSVAFVANEIWSVSSWHTCCNRFWRLACETNRPTDQQEHERANIDGKYSERCSRFPSNLKDS